MIRYLKVYMMFEGGMIQRVSRWAFRESMYRRELQNITPFPVCPLLHRYWMTVGSAKSEGWEEGHTPCYDKPPGRRFNGGSQRRFTTAVYDGGSRRAWTETEGARDRVDNVQPGFWSCSWILGMSSDIATENSPRHSNLDQPRHSGSVVDEKKRKKKPRPHRPPSLDEPPS